MIAIIDSSPLISLAVIDQLILLDKLFSGVIVPPAVQMELNASSDKNEYRNINKFIQHRIRKPVKQVNFPDNFGMGETEAIALYLELKAELLIIDDKKARKYAESLDIKCLGTLGLLVLAKKKGLVNELRKYFILLLKNERYFASGLLNHILKLNHEKSL